MKTIAIMQPYFFPYFPYYQLINIVDEFVFLDDVNYVKKKFINRNTFLSNSKPALFTIPLSKASQNKKINEVSILDHRWARKFENMLQRSYGKAEYFREVFPVVERVIGGEYNNIAELAKASIIESSVYLELDTSFYSSTELALGSTLSGQDRIIAICKELDADRYINPIGGLTAGIYDFEKFNKVNIQLSFLKSEGIFYKQKGAFVRNLSIIDVMMHESKYKIKECKDFDLVGDNDVK